MKAKSIIRLLPVFLIQLFFIFLSCSNNSSDNITTPQNGNITSIPNYPPFNDTIPFDVLGSGTIVFERIGPQPSDIPCVYVIDIDNKKVYPNYNCSSQCYVSPQGNKIAFCTYTNFDFKNDIYLVNIDGKDHHKLISLKGWVKFPSWSTDGEKIYFWNDAEGPTNLYSISVKQNSLSPTLIKTFTPKYFPSGRFVISCNNKIAYVINNALYTTDNGLYIMDQNGIICHQIVKNTNIDSIYFDSPVFSKDGKQIYYFKITRPELPNGRYGCYRKIELIKINIEGNNSTVIAELPASGCKQFGRYGYMHKTNDVFLALSPNGEKFILNLPEGEHVSHLYILNSDGSGLTQITSADSIIDHCVSWGK